MGGARSEPRRGGVGAAEVQCGRVEHAVGQGGVRLVEGAVGSGRLQLDDSADVGAWVAELGMDGWILRAGADDVVTVSSGDGQLWLQLGVAGQDDGEAGQTGIGLAGAAAGQRGLAGAAAGH